MALDFNTWINQVIGGLHLGWFKNSKTDSKQQQALPFLQAKAPTTQEKTILAQSTTPTVAPKPISPKKTTSNVPEVGAKAPMPLSPPKVLPGEPETSEKIAASYNALYNFRAKTYGMVGGCRYAKNSETGEIKCLCVGCMERPDSAQWVTIPDYYPTAADFPKNIRDNPANTPTPALAKVTAATNKSQTITATPSPLNSLKATAATNPAQVPTYKATQPFKVVE